MSRQQTLEVKVEFSQRALNLIGSSAHHEHLISAASALKLVAAPQDVVLALGRVF